MREPTSYQRQLLRWISEGRGPAAQVRLASTSWWMGDLSVTRDMNALLKMGLLRSWRDAARNQHIALTDEGRSLV